MSDTLPIVVVLTFLAAVTLFGYDAYQTDESNRQTQRMEICIAAEMEWRDGNCVREAKP